MNIGVVTMVGSESVVTENRSNNIIRGLTGEGDGTGLRLGSVRYSEKTSLGRSPKGRVKSHSRSLDGLRCTKSGDNGGS